MPDTSGLGLQRAEPLLLARLTLEVQRFGRSSQGTRKFFQPMKGLQDPAWMPRIWTEGGGMSFLEGPSTRTGLLS
eukprot:g15961.t1